MKEINWYAEEDRQDDRDGLIHTRSARGRRHVIARCEENKVSVTHLRSWLRWLGSGSWESEVERIEASGFGSAAELRRTLSAFGAVETFSHPLDTVWSHDDRLSLLPAGWDGLAVVCDLLDECKVASWADVRAWRGSSLG